MAATAIMVAICAPWVEDHTRRGTTMKTGPNMLLFEVGFFLKCFDGMAWHGMAWHGNGDGDGDFNGDGKSDGNGNGDGKNKQSN